MPKIYSESPQTKAVYDKIMNKIKGITPLGNNEHIIKRWKFDNEIHSGQIYSTKILPNGNVQTRITTIVGDINTFINDINVTKKSGEILKNYFTIIWRFKEKSQKFGRVTSENVLPTGNIQKRMIMAISNDATIVTDTRVKSSKGKLLRAYFGIRGPMCTVTEANGDVVRKYLPTKIYANTMKAVSNAHVNMKVANPDMKFLF